MLEIKGLRAGYGRIPILAGIDLSVVPGEVLGILGHNGMGKTTLIRTLMGFLPATAGSVTFEGADITSLPTHRRARMGLGYVPQGRRIFPRLTVRENLAMGALGRSESEVNRVIGQFPRLRPLLDRPGGALSGGEQQILAMARCLCASPRLVLFDEPTEGIQPSIIEELGALLASLNRDLGLTIIVVEQNLDFIADLATRAAILQKGTIARELAPTQLRDAEVIDEFVGMNA